MENKEKTRLEQAVAFALEAHGGAKRKGKERPYILHPLEVLTIVAGLTEDEDVQIGAVLHDTVEDTGTSVDEIRTLFGERVASLVSSESEDKSKSWEERKKTTIDHLRQESREVKLICLGDKLSNIREIGRDHERIGDEIWKKFNQKDKKKHAWYYGCILGVLKKEFKKIPEILEYETLMTRIFGNDWEHITD